MNILMIASEAHPWGRTGGLGDVCGAMAKYLAAAGHLVMLFVPWYKKISDAYSGKVTAGLNNLYYSLCADGVKVVFVNHEFYFGREGFYNHPDNLERFTFFCEQSLRLAKEMGFKPDIVHAHDWQAAAAVIMLKTAYRKDQFFENTKVVFTIHNVAHQGIFDSNQFEVLGKRGIDRCHFNHHELEYYGKINLLKGAILYADWVYTVSPNHAKEVRTAAFGKGMEYYLKSRGGSFCGILNGLDPDTCDPKTNPNVLFQYDVNSFGEKKKNKLALQEQLGLEVNEKKTLLVFVGRLTDQKGIDVVAESIPLLPEDYQLAILGDSDEVKPKELLSSLCEGRETSYSLTIAFDENLASMFYAAGDAFWMPSKHEPCGLTQLIAYRYGTLPIVFPVGGLVDTVTDYFQGGHGFVCDRNEMNSSGFMKKINEVLDLRRNHISEWEARAIAAMGLNFGWEESIKRVLSIYDYLVSGIFPF